MIYFRKNKRSHLEPQNKILRTIGRSPGERPVMTDSIHYDNIEGQGMLFILRENPVSNLVLMLSNTRYNLVGFYYETNVSGSRRIKIILTDLSDIGSGRWLPPLNLNDVLSDRIINKAVFRPFIDQAVSEDDRDIRSSGLFREILAGIIPNQFQVEQPNDDLIQEWMYYLLMGTSISKRPDSRGPGAFRERIQERPDSRGPGAFRERIQERPDSRGPGAFRERIQERPETSHRKNKVKSEQKISDFETSVYLINNFILDISDTISRHDKDSDDSDDDNNMNIRSDEKIRYLLADLGFFDDPIEIHLPKHKKKVLDRYLIDPSILLKSISLNFTRLYLEYEDFRRKCLWRLYSTDDGKTMSNADSVVIQNLMSSGHYLSEYILSSLTKGFIDPNNLIDRVQKYNHDSSATASSFSIDPLFVSDNELKDDLIRLVSVCPSTHQDNPHVSPILLLTSLRDKIDSLVQAVSAGETPLLNINDLSDTVNSLLSLTGHQLENIPTLEGETSVPSIISVTSGHRSGIPIRLSNDNKVVLSLMGEDLDKFSKDDLQEILSILDVMSDGDNRFDDMRAKIVDALH